MSFYVPLNDKIVSSSSGGGGTAKFYHLDGHKITYICSCVNDQSYIANCIQL